MTRDVIEDVRLLAPTSVRTDEVARARQWKKLANAMTEEISSSRESIRPIAYVQEPRFGTDAPPIAASIL